MNIAALLDQIAEEFPQAPAVIVPWKNKTLNFQELNEESGRLAAGLAQLGIAKGDRVLLLVPFSVDFITLTFALFKAGAVPVLIDPGLGKKNTLQCIGQAQPKGMIAIPKAHVAKQLFPTPFKSIELSITVGWRWFWGGDTLDKVRKLGKKILPPADREENDPAAILFTSGSTGPSKGVVYTHGMFCHQIEVLKSCFRIQPGEIDLPTFPLFGLFSICMGMTCVLPDMDFTQPAQVNPGKIIKPIQEYSITNSFGSPALWNTVSKYCIRKKVRLSSLKRILMAGAPVPGNVLKRFDKILDDSAEIHTPYGATEALPVTSINRKMILQETWEKTQRGMGICVGLPVPGIALKIIKIFDDPIQHWNPDLEQSPFEVGEIVVQGPWVTRKYFNAPNNANQFAKIAEGDDSWHRMGDLGWLDEQGRLWFCGRKGQRVITKSETLYTLPCEAIFNTHPKVKRSALVGVGEKGDQEAVIVVEPEEKDLINASDEREALIQELLELGKRFPHTEQIKFFLMHPEFPVDIRHNAKIFREQLADWAEEKVTE
jgi:acyl-CoA synthetase (AMP-forming)/AMP-acid ligase II